MLVREWITLLCPECGGEQAEALMVFEASPDGEPTSALFATELCRQCAHDDRLTPRLMDGGEAFARVVFAAQERYNEAVRAARAVRDETIDAAAKVLDRDTDK